MQYESTAIKVQGKSIKDLPKDLYIPPDAMLVILDLFEGPLDLLLYLIRKNNLNIIEISVASITQQYIKYIEEMQRFNLGLTADYLEMAAILTEIKSRMLLPILESNDAIEEDPRAILILRLQEYEQIKQAASNLDQMPRHERDYFSIRLLEPITDSKILPEIKLQDVLVALQSVLAKQNLNLAHNIIKESLSVRDKMTAILTTLQAWNGQEIHLNCRQTLKFSDFLNFTEGRLGIVVTFMAMLELVKDNLLEILQQNYNEPIYIKLAKHE